MQASEKTVHPSASEPAGIDDRRKGNVKLSEQAKGRLGLHLRAMYGDLVAQPVPNRFRDLIAKLDDPSRS